MLPSGDPENTEVLRKFVTAVLAAEPDATGPAVMLYEAGNTIVRAFIEAGIFALAAIALLLWITLRRLTDVLMTLVPLLLAAVEKVPIRPRTATAFPSRYSNTQGRKARSRW